MQQQQEALDPVPAPDSPGQRGPFPRTRVIVMLAIAAVLIALSVIIWVSNGSVLTWGSVATGLLALLLALLPFVQWLFPLNPVAWSSRDPRVLPEPGPPHVVTAPSMAKSPFHFDETQLPAPAEYFGREYERGTLLTRIGARSSTALIGEYRIGKSWLMQFLMLSIPTHPQLGQRVRIGRLSATHPQSQTLAGFVKRALEVLDAPDYRAGSRETPLEHLAVAVRNLKKLELIPVLCIDEFAGLIGKPGFDKNFITGLRAIAEDDGLVLITASRHSLHTTIQDMTGDTSPLFNIMQELTLRPFNEQEARDFVEQKGRQAGFSQEEQRFLLSSAASVQPDGKQGWPPLRLQLAGQLLFTEKYRSDGQHRYALKDPAYQSALKQRMEEAYQAVVSRS